MKNNLTVLGDFDKAYKSLKDDQNNVVSALAKNEKNLKSGLLEKAVFTLKDNYATAEYITQSSSQTLKGFKPFYNAEIYDLLINQGASLVAKVHADEFGLGGSGLFSGYGIIKHPQDDKRIIGGSSSGSVASMYYNVAFSIGSDTGDSVRNPAGYNGFVGFKPTYGAVSRYGLFAYASSMDTVAYFTHNVNDAFVLSKVLFKKDNKDMTSIRVDLDEQISFQKPLKLGFLGNLNYLQKDIKNNYLELSEKLKKENIEVDFLDLDEELLNHIKTVYDVLSYSEATSNLANIKGLQFGNKTKGKNWEEIVTNSRSDFFGEMVQRRLTLGSLFLSVDHINDVFYNAQKMRQKITEYMSSKLKDYDAFVYPASDDVAPLIEGENKKPNFMQWILTNANLSGVPSIVIPWIKVNNLPVGLAIDTKLKEDQKLLNIALYFEEFLGAKSE
ncbi:amidase family protein [Mycoplasmopsis agassizii]|uniref:Asp-tRNA(Asn)/Glu-tRNA(Gln) amidotransferase GatCAB subunit A n=1 Tax=Mycoplasmopsis agassizii TaxID=33922 RepID=A0ABX4H6K0_9BACT|nr:amidase family protein [Mycoplasmopsis agassizii]PAF55496.1 Asp-tRNA(Asn)/Glu-tRNA(Gln) amidotransferase GatCAB subunit A [Mycoplasmopsis agassizii]SMC18073.1 aspartyl/glutamyl-tRNA(Asn/Gln) amidotransferase subunit A [Mycoplasmopsis agassizii]